MRTEIQTHTSTLKSGSSIQSDAQKPLIDMVMKFFITKDKEESIQQFSSWEEQHFCLNVALLYSTAKIYESKKGNKNCTISEIYL